MLVYYFVPFIVSNRYLLFWVSNGHNSVTVQNRTHVYMNFFDHKDLGNHLLQLCPKVVKHPVYGIITTKKSIKHPLCLLFHLTFTSWSLPYKTPAVTSQYMWTPIFHCTSCLFGKCPVDWTWLPTFQEKKSKWKWRKWRLNYTLNSTALYDEISSCIILLQYSAFTLPGKLLQTISNAPQVLLSVAFSFVLKLWSSRSCLNCGPTKIHSFI